MKKDVKKKHLPPPLGKTRVWRLTSSPTSFLEGLVVWLLWPAARSSGDANPSCLSQLDDFMKQWCSTPFGYEATQAKRWLKCQPRSYVRLEAYSFFGLSEGA